jgi:N-acetylmuramoyl-L-alanine amidase
MTASKKSFLRIVVLLWTMCLSISYMAEAQNFVLVIDAGHGGHDPGALGKKAKEKDINLNVALKLGKLVQENCPDVKVIYTRSKDVFISLNRRAEIANNAKADLFISIHTNSVAGNNKIMGASTWTLGLAKSDANLDVAKRENSVILYEDDYKTSYAGFDPNSAESYIIFEFMQDNYMSQSVHLASLVQSELKNTSKRRDQGVHQAGFLVLKASAMPSILVELGFISTPAEEQFLSSESGATTMAKGIFRAFQTYKKEQETKQGGATAQPAESTSLTTKKNFSSEEDKKVTQSASKEVGKTNDGTKPVFKIQFLTAGKKLANNDRRLSGLSDVDFYVENGTYKYTCGASTDYNKVRATLKEVTKRYKDAFIIAFREEKKINVNDAIKEFSAK